MNRGRYLVLGTLSFLLSLLASFPPGVWAQEARPRVVVLESDPSRNIARTVRQTDFQFGLTLENQNSEKDVDDLEITLGPLVRSDGVVEDGAVLTSTMDSPASTPLVVTRGGRRVLTVSGRLPQPAQYTRRMPRIAST
jgi:hypothetical protein